MNIKTNPTHWVFLIVIICLISGCNIVLGLKHYVPPEGSNLEIEFDYPKNWEWVYQPESSMIYAFEPGKPQYTFGDIPTSADAGKIDISVDIYASAEIMEERIKSWREATKAIGGEVMEDKAIMIDGVSARWISRRIPARPIYNPDYDVYSIVVFVYENYILYDLYLETSFEERDGEFVRDFNRMISTIEFVP
jgi:hypothetical protein